MTNSELLQERIQISGLKKSEIMKQTGIKAYATLRSKVENRSEFTASEIQRLCEILNINYEDREAIFFANNAEPYSA